MVRASGAPVYANGSVTRGCSPGIRCLQGRNTNDTGACVQMPELTPAGFVEQWMQRPGHVTVTERSQRQGALRGPVFLARVEPPRAPDRRRGDRLGGPRRARAA